MLSERSIINGLILIAGMILGPYLITLTFELNQVALLAFSCLVGLFVIFFFIKDRIALCPFIATYFGGNLNFLPFGLNLVEVASLMTILYYFIHHVALKRSRLVGGPRYFLFPMIIIAGIVLYHDHQISLHALGGAQEGSRPGLLILLAIMAYVCGINIPTPSASFLSRIPWWCLGMTVFAALPFALTTYFPSLSPYVYFISGNINISAYVESVDGGDTSDLSRNGAFLGIAGTLQGIMLAYYPISTWWRPSRWALIALSLICLYGTLIGGYRSSLFSFIGVVLLSAMCYMRWRILFGLPLLILTPLALIVLQNNHNSEWVLSKNIQRTMSFLPGDWDPDVKDSAVGSNEFRSDITRVYVHEYLYKSPWIGNGFAFDPAESESYDNMIRTPGASDPSYYFSKAFITSKNFHVGWISLYDAVGIIGSIAFVALDLCLIWRTGYFIFRKASDLSSPYFPVEVWLFCNLAVGLVSYFTTFGSFNQAFVGMCGTATVIVHLERMQRRNEFPAISPSPQTSFGFGEGLAVMPVADIHTK